MLPSSQVCRRSIGGELSVGSSVRRSVGLTLSVGPVAGPADLRERGNPHYEQLLRRLTCV